MDAWLWDDLTHYTREERALNFFKAEDESRTKCLGIQRICACLVFYLIVLPSLLLMGSGSPDLRFFTNWSAMTFGLYYTLIMFAHIKYIWMGKSPPHDSSNPF